MNAPKRTILAVVFLGLSCFTSTGLAGPSGTSCSINIPAGTIIRVYPDEQIVAGTTSGPLLFTVAADVRFFLNRPSILPRGSKVLGRMENSTRAGHLWGRSTAQLAFTSILTPDFCEYAIDATLISTKKYQVSEEVIVGRGHARRDAVLLLFPPTTLYQLLRLPARGPQLVFREEEQLVIKLLEPVYSTKSESNPVDRTTPIEQTRESPTVECPKIATNPMLLPNQGRIVRSFQNATRHQVTVYGNGTPIGTLAPCSESVILLPRGELKLKAIATIPDNNGQREVEAPLGLNDKSTGWQVRSVKEQSSTLR